MPDPRAETQDLGIIAEHKISITRIYYAKDGKRGKPAYTEIHINGEHIGNTPTQTSREIREYIGRHLTKDLDLPADSFF